MEKGLGFSGVRHNFRSSFTLKYQCMSTAEHQRLTAANQGASWKKWGPYLSERQWGTVREDYSRDGSAWEYTPHDHARSRAYRWGEDGLGGISDSKQLLCFCVALWNHKDPILKERLFGLTGPEGNHAEDVKEYYYYLDSTPTHSYMKYLYKYPQKPFPYELLVNMNMTRGKDEPEYELVDTGVFDDNRYFDVFVEYAKASEEDICIKIRICNRGPEEAPITVLPTLWFRNTWSWEESEDHDLPVIVQEGLNVEATHNQTGKYYFYAAYNKEFIFCENETNVYRLFGEANAHASAKDGINDYIVKGDLGALSPESKGSKCAAWYKFHIPAGEEKEIQLRLSKSSHADPFGAFQEVFHQRKKEADTFYADLQKEITSEDLRLIQRQAYAGMMWTKQFYNFKIRDWLKGDPHHSPPPVERKSGRNHRWQHMDNCDIISMPDKWEYPWYAVWDSAFHCVPLARLDMQFAKEQLLLFLKERYMHPNGQIPAYEWDFSDVNPPVHGWGVWKVYQMEKEQTGEGDLEFLKQAFHKLILNFTWWVNRKDRDGNNIFEGGFLGLDNIGVFDRSRPLPTGGYIEQADGTSWMAMYSLNLMRMAQELALKDDTYEHLAIKFFDHFLHIASSLEDLGGLGIKGHSLWDEEDNFFYDILNLPDGHSTSLRVRSIVGIIPLFAVEVLEADLLEKLPKFRAYLDEIRLRRPDLCKLVSRWDEPGEEDKKLFSLVRGWRMTKVLERVIDEAEFLSDFGMRGLSKHHLTHPYTYKHNGQDFSVAYVPAESDTYLFGGNSNWRGPIWFPINYMLLESLQKFYSYYGDRFVLPHPEERSENRTQIPDIINSLSHRLINIFARDKQGKRAVYDGFPTLFQEDPHFRDYILFYEYFHGDTGRGVGASHQTGWTGLIAEIIHHAHLGKEASSFTYD